MAPHQTAKVRFGDSNGSVLFLQCVLNDLGYGLTVDGKFGSRTLAAVKSWQGAHPYLGPVDGVVGPNTWKSLLAGSKKY